jgi:hypothetical protein
MTSRVHILLVALLLSALFLGACSPAPAPTPVDGMAATLAIRTLVAQRGMVIFTTPSATPAPDSAQPAENQPGGPAIPASLALTPSPTPLRTPVVYSFNESKDNCQNKAKFINDVTVPDDTIVTPGEKLTKVWQFQNAGNCTWTTAYSLVFLWGDQMNAASPTLLTAEVKPGQMGNIILNLEAPALPNYYQGNWIFADESGNQFGTGTNGKNYFWVSIEVGVPGLGGGVFGCISGH